MKSLARLSASLIALGLVACHRDHPEDIIAVPVLVSSIAPESGGRGAHFSADIVADSAVDLQFKVNGYIQSITQVKGHDGKMRNLQGGDPVKSGEVVATVRDDSYRQKVLDAKAQVESARAVLARAARDYERDKQLLKAGVIAQRDFDAAKQEAATAQAQVQSAQAGLRNAQVDLDDCKLKSPMNGVVLSRKIEKGELLMPSQTGFQVADTNSVKAIFGVPAAQIERFHQGDRLAIGVQTIPGVDFKGVISRVAPSADPNTRLFDIEVRIPNPDGRLHVGMIARSQALASTNAAPILAIPIGAIVRPPSDPKGFAVFTVEQKEGKSIAKIQTIALGPIVGNQIAVNQGLKAGDRVIVQGAEQLVDGQQVAVLDQ